jgi:chemotaxis protein MotB
MMAFFLVMWLVNQSTPVKAAIGGYFRDPGVFDGGKGLLPGGTSAAEPVALSVEPTEERKELDQTVDHIRGRLDQIPEFKTLKNQIEFSVTPEGLRIDLADAEGSSFFDSGSGVLHRESDRILSVIARELGKLNQEVLIEGHTDRRQYVGTAGYSNWELSADRANAARRVLEREGLKPGQVAGVRGQADRQLRFADEPLDPRNRRVSIVVMSPAAASRRGPG